MRAGLAAVCLAVTAVASPGSRLFAQDKSAASEASPAEANPPTAAPPGTDAPSSAASVPAAPEASQPSAAQPAPPPSSAPSQEPAAQAPASQAAEPPTTAPAGPSEENPPPPAGSPPSEPSAPTAPNPPPSPPAAATPAPPPTKSVLDKHLILGVLGKDVKSAKGEDMGRIVDVIVDNSGQTRAAIIDFGGFLGVGSRRIAVDWNALHFEPQQKGDQITLDLTRDQVKAAPEYKEGQPVVVLGPSGATEPIPYD